MDEQDNYKFVNFEHYCDLCEYKNNSESSKECNECLSYPALKYSEKPINFKEKGE